MKLYVVARSRSEAKLLSFCVDHKNVWRDREDAHALLKNIDTDPLAFHTPFKVYVVNQNTMPRIRVKSKPPKNPPIDHMTEAYARTRLAESPLASILPTSVRLPSPAPVSLPPPPTILPTKVVIPLKDYVVGEDFEVS